MGICVQREFFHRLRSIPKDRRANEICSLPGFVRKLKRIRLLINKIDGI